jgi:prefoldin subunit 5
MKKVKIFILFMTLFLGILIMTPVKVFANLTYDGTAEDWFYHISQFEYTDYGLAFCEIYQYAEQFGLKIVEEPFHEVEGLMYEYDLYINGDLQYFEPVLGSKLQSWLWDLENVMQRLESYYYGEGFDGHFYWNFEEQYWQALYYGTSELDYYRQRVDELEDEISSLEDEIQELEDEISLLEDEIQELEDENSLLEDEIQELEDEISLLEDEISSLEDEISSLENENSLLEDEIQELEDEIQELEDAFDLEYDRGYNDGYDVGYNEGLLVENNDINITKWFVPLVVVIILVGIIEPIILLKRRG